MIIILMDFTPVLCKRHARQSFPIILSFFFLIFENQSAAGNVIQLNEKNKPNVNKNIKKISIHLTLVTLFYAPAILLTSELH